MKTAIFKSGKDLRICSQTYPGADSSTPKSKVELKATFPLHICAKQYCNSKNVEKHIFAITLFLLNPYLAK